MKEHNLYYTNAIEQTLDTSDLRFTCLPIRDTDQRRVFPNQSDMDVIQFNVQEEFLLELKQKANEFIEASPFRARDCRYVFVEFTPVEHCKADGVLYEIHFAFTAIC